MSGSDRRRNQRREGRSAVYYRLVDATGPGTSRLRGAVSGNLSAGGLLLLTRHEHGPGTRLELELLLPARSGSPVCRHVVFAGEVIRCEPVPGSGARFEVGVRMDALSDEDRDHLAAYLVELGRNAV